MRQSSQSNSFVIMVAQIPDAKHRTIVVGLVWNQHGELLFCRMDPDRGVFPGQWGFPGGGIEPGERMEDALDRGVLEVRPERRV